jgi:hypothetical protein
VNAGVPSGVKANNAGPAEAALTKRVRPWLSTTEIAALVFSKPNVPEKAAASTPWLKASPTIKLPAIPSMGRSARWESTMNPRRGVVRAGWAKDRAAIKHRTETDDKSVCMAKGEK